MRVNPSYNKIWKYEFEVSDKAIIDMPFSAKVLSVGTQKPRHICVWVEVPSVTTHTSRRVFYVRGTGHPLDFPKYEPNEALNGFLGTVIDEQFVWHVFGQREQ